MDSRRLAPAVELGIGLETLGSELDPVHAAWPIPRDGKLEADRPTGSRSPGLSGAGRRRVLADFQLLDDVHDPLGLALANEHRGARGCIGRGENLDGVTRRGAEGAEIAFDE